MFYEIVYAFGVPNHDLRDYCHWEAINFTRLAHARVLYGFLGTKQINRHEDDVLAEDYGYVARPNLLSADDQLRLNKDLFHLTYSRLRHTRESKRWPSRILSNLLEPTLDFMRHIRDHTTDLLRSPEEVNSWCELIERLESGREL